jgi:8-oxo-dGTP diphosphatase
MPPLLFTQVLCRRDDQVLMMKRTKEPNLGLWVAPGGKIERDEAPFECAVRELREETGLRASDICLRGMLTVVMPDILQPCMHFLYLVTDFAGQLVADEREGVLGWWPVDEVERLPMPQAVAKFLPRVLDATWPFYQAKHVYDAGWQLIDAVEHATQSVRLDRTSGTP